MKTVNKTNLGQYKVKTERNICKGRTFKLEQSRQKTQKLFV